METPVRPESGSESNAPIAQGRLCAVVRQPILDLRSRVHAYKLHLRGGTESGDNGEAAWRATAEAAAFFALQKPSELKKLTGKMPAFVRCPMAALNDELAQVLSATLTVLELPSDVEISAEFIAACQQLKDLGFRFALDGSSGIRSGCRWWIWQITSRWTFAGRSRRNGGNCSNSSTAKQSPCLPMALTPQASYRRAREEGFALFEGYFFCEPVPVRNRRPPVNQLLRLEILKALQQNPLDLRKLAELVKRDGPLTFQLLRLVNSPLWPCTRLWIQSRFAMLALGDDAIRRVATMAIASEFNGSQPAELLCLAMVRARFCEVAGSSSSGTRIILAVLAGAIESAASDAGPTDERRGSVVAAGQGDLRGPAGTKNKERALLDG